MKGLRQSFRQTWEDARRQPAFTSIYIGGVALAIAFTMIFAMIYYVKLAPVYPEYNRANTLYMSYVSFKMKDGSMTCSSNVGYPFFRDYLATVENAEIVSGFVQDASIFLRSTDGTSMFKAERRGVDPAFFKLYGFEFLAGKPFSEADLNNAVPVVVVSHRIAERLFGTPEEAVGKEIDVNDEKVRIAGVVREGSILTPQSFAQVYCPYTTVPGYAETGCNQPWIGAFEVRYLVKDARQEQALRKEIEDIQRRINATDTTGVLSIGRQPVGHYELAFTDYYYRTEFSWMTVAKKYATVLLVLLLVPAMNLAGMIAGRMDGRLPEMGIRKSFGATRHRLLSQVLAENFYMTLAGGVLGLVVAWVIMVVNRSWIYGIMSEYGSIPADTVTTEVSGEMLFAPAVFIATLLLCIVLNMLSGLIPAWWSLRRPIISSINEKR